MAQDNGLGGVLVNHLNRVLEKGVGDPALEKDLGQPSFREGFEKFVRGGIKVGGDNSRSVRDREFHGRGGSVRLKEIGGYPFVLDRTGVPVSRVTNPPSFRSVLKNGFPTGESKRVPPKPMITELSRRVAKTQKADQKPDRAAFQLAREKTRDGDPLESRTHRRERAARTVTARA